MCVCVFLFFFFSQIRYYRLFFLLIRKKISAYVCLFLCSIPSKKLMKMMACYKEFIVFFLYIDSFCFCLSSSSFVFIFWCLNIPFYCCLLLHLLIYSRTHICNEWQCVCLHQCFVLVLLRNFLPVHHNLFCVPLIFSRFFFPWFVFLSMKNDVWTLDLSILFCLSLFLSEYSNNRWLELFYL